ncbi:MAG: DUF86 domain-containing protein [Syntrophales bacterium]|jgi:uncharacterized protein with HEPN domain|nr:DUF86 domain-containing protein [Syntrophales bacterium]MDY0045399.1 DUF86 domain-containing protein [Syntrophales bacterium]
MPRDPRLYLDDILEAIIQIREYTASIDFESFVRDRKTQDAVVRNLEIIGEAAGRLPEFLKSRALHIEWHKIAGLRNILIHEYFGINLPIVWDIVLNKLDSLEIACRELLETDNYSKM